MNLEASDPRSNLVELFISCWTSLVAQTEKNPTCNAGNLGLTPESGRSSEEGNGYPLQYSCLENSMNRGTWWAIVHGDAESQTQMSD